MALIIPSDHSTFNCSEKHELDYVVGLYDDKEKEKVRSFIQAGCKSGKIKNFTHKQLYTMLAQSGFHKKTTAKV